MNHSIILVTPRRYFFEALQGVFCPPDPIPGTNADDVGGSAQLTKKKKGEVVTYNGKKADCTEDKYKQIKKYFVSMDYLKFAVGTKFLFGVAVGNSGETSIFVVFSRSAYGVRVGVL